MWSHRKFLVALGDNVHCVSVDQNFIFNFRKTLCSLIWLLQVCLCWKFSLHFGKTCYAKAFISVGTWVEPQQRSLPGLLGGLWSS